MKILKWLLVIGCILIAFVSFAEGDWKVACIWLTLAGLIGIVLDLARQIRVVADVVLEHQREREQLRPPPQYLHGDKQC